MARINRSSMFPSGGDSKVTRSIINAFSVAGWASTAVNAIGFGDKIVLSGALTANTLKTIFSKLDGPCEFTQLSFYTNDSTIRTMRVKVTVDGVSVFDYTSASFGINQNGCCLAGYINSQYNINIGTIRSSSSLVIEIASNLTETDKFSISYAAQELN